MNWSVFGKAFLCETVYAIPFFILSILPFKKQLRFPIKILILFILSVSCSSPPCIPT